MPRRLLAALPVQCIQKLVFVPTRLNLHEMIPAYDLAVRLGCETFVTGPLMRLGRAAINWNDLACSAGDWQIAAQAMLLVVPNGKVRLMNALLFVAANLQHDDMDTAWDAYCRAWRSRQVADFIGACHTNPDLLKHANATWPATFS